MSIRVEKVNYIYGKGTPYERKALDGVNLEIHKWEFVGIIGHTGSGKSTLVQHLNGLLHPSEGRVTVDGVDLAGKDKETIAKRHSVGMVFQYPDLQMFEETVKKYIAFGPTNMGLEEDGYGRLWNSSGWIIIPMQNGHHFGCPAVSSDEWLSQGLLLCILIS